MRENVENIVKSIEKKSEHPYYLPSCVGCAHTIVGARQGPPDPMPFLQFCGHPKHPGRAYPECPDFDREGKIIRR